MHHVKFMLLIMNIVSMPTLVRRVAEEVKDTVSHLVRPTRPNCHHPGALDSRVEAPWADLLAL